MNLSSPRHLFTSATRGNALPRYLAVSQAARRTSCTRALHSVTANSRSLQSHWHRIQFQCWRSHVYRTFSMTSSRSQATTFTDPTRADLFYHLVSGPAHLQNLGPVFAVSFLETPPSSPESDTIIGWIPANAGDEAGLNDFKENPNFLRLLHTAVSSGLREGIDDIQINGATQLQEGWMHIHDTRNVPALGRIGDPDDILGSVLVQDSKILADTYSPMPSYRVCTADGVPKLTDGLAQKLRDVLAARAREEETASRS